jgi:hypothetical protein
MEPDENKVTWTVVADQTEDEVFYDYDSSDFKITFANIDINYDNDSTYGVVPEENNPLLYTSYEQREQHDKYPALKKAWEDYVKMFNLTKGEPPVVD